MAMNASTGRRGQVLERDQRPVLDEELADHARVRAEDLGLERGFDHLEAGGAGKIAREKYR